MPKSEDAEKSDLGFFIWCQELAGCFNYLRQDFLSTFLVVTMAQIRVSKTIPPTTELVKTLTMFGKG